MEKKKSLLKRILKITGLVVLVVIVLFGAFVAFVFLDKRDIAPVNDSSLMLKKMNVDAKNNSFELVNSLKFVGKFDSGQLLATKNWDDVTVAKVLADNKESLKTFDEIASKKYFVDPKFDPNTAGLDYVFTGMRTSREIARLALLQSESMRRRGDSQGAFNESEKVIIFGQTFSNSSSSVIQFLVGVAIKNMGLNQAIKVADDHELTSEFILTKKAELQDDSSLSEPLKNGLKGEYGLGVWAINEMKKNPELAQSYSPIKALANGKNFYFKINETHSLHKQLFVSMVENAGTKCKKGDNRYQGTLLMPQLYGPGAMYSDLGSGYQVKPWKAFAKMVFTENAFGKSIVDTIGLGLSDLNQKRCDSDAKFDTLLTKLK